MSNSKLVNVYVPAHTGNYSKGRSGRTIQAITIHHMGGVGSAESCGRIFQRVGRYGSSHYGIGNDGRIGQYVDEANTAWTNSNWDSNCKSVTIETSNSVYGGTWAVSDRALNSLIKLVADIAKRNNLGTLVKGKNVTWHSMFAATDCPGPYLLAKMDYIIAEANKINNPEEVLEEETYPGVYPNLGTKGYLGYGDKGVDVIRLQDFLNWCMGTNLAKDGSFGPATLDVVKDYQLRYGLDVDGYFGPASLAKAKTIKKDIPYGYPGEFPVLPGRGAFMYGDKGKEVGKLQALLNWCSDTNLMVDNSFGPATLAAVKKYQQQYGLTVDGFFGPKCLAKAKTIKK